MPILPIAAFVLLFNFYFGFHGFLLFKSLKWKFALQLPEFLAQIPNWVYWAVFIAIAAIYAGIGFARGLGSLFRLANAYWGIFVFIPLLMVLDLVYLFRFLARVIIMRFNVPLVSPFWGQSFTLIAHLIVIVIVIFVTAFGSWRARTPVLTEYQIATEKPIPNGKMEILLVSDLHVGALIKKERFDKMVTKLNDLDGDMVLIAGDILDRGLELWESENLGEGFGRLHARYGVWAVPGNHDYYGGFIRELRENLAAFGVKLLEDEVDHYDFSQPGFIVVGRRDRMAGRESEYRKPLDDLVAGVDKSRFLILLDHQPVFLTEAEKAGFDLQVSGHTHHGQIWPASLITGHLFENDYGLSFRGKSAFVVTSGYGTWGPSLRIGTKSEIVRITVTGENSR